MSGASGRISYAAQANCWRPARPGGRSTVTLDVPAHPPQGAAPTARALRVARRLGAGSKSTKLASLDVGRRTGAGGIDDVAWLDLGDQPIDDWLQFRALFTEFLAEVEEQHRDARGVGVTGLALLLPGDHRGHLSAAFLRALIPERVRERWIGVPVRLEHAAMYSAASHATGGQRYRPFEMFRRLGFRVQGEVDGRSLARAEELESDLLLGSTPRERLGSFLELLPRMDRLRFSHSTIEWMPAAPTPTPTAAPAAMEVNADCVRSAPSKYSSIESLSPSTEVPTLWREAVRTGLLTEFERVELLLVARGLRRVWRTQVEIADQPKLREFLNRMDMANAWCTRQVRVARDRGKGGFSSVYSADDVAAELQPQLFGYVARDATTAERAMALEEAGDDDGFGELLGYPVCCRLAFRRNFELAVRTGQGDVAPFVADQTTSSAPWPFTLNIGAWYFQAGLVSFFPCSFDCPAARSVGREAFAALSAVLPPEAEAMRALLSSPVLYTEYRGVYLLDGAAEMSAGTIRYERGRVRATSNGRVRRLLGQGDTLVADDSGRVEVFRGRRRIGAVGGRRVRLLRFGEIE